LSSNSFFSAACFSRSGIKVSKILSDALGNERSTLDELKIDNADVLQINTRLSHLGVE
jgi:hypothetical protein